MEKDAKVVKLTIENRTIFRVMAVGFAFVLGLQVLGALEPVLRLLVMAAFLAMALNPPVNYLAHKMTRGKRGWATAISYIFVLLVLALFLLVIIPPFIRESTRFIDGLPGYIDNIKNGHGFWADLIRNMNIDTQLEKLSANLSGAFGNANDILLNGVGAIGGFVFSLLTVLVLAFFMLIEGPKWFNHFWETRTPAFRKHYEPLIYRMYGVVTGFVNGQLLVAFIASMTSLAALLVVGVPYPLPLASIVFLCSLIPLVGGTLGSLLVSVFALFTSAYAAIFMLVYFIVYQQIENNAIQPYVQSKNLDVSPLLVLTAVLVGASLGGLLGALIAIPVAASGKILYVDYHDRRYRKNYGKTPTKI